MSNESLASIMSDGYNMRVEEISKTHVVVSIGGSRREFDLDNSVVEQIDNARKALGCSPLLNLDKKRIEQWQAENALSA